MQKLQTVKLLFTVFFTSGFVIAGYEMRAAGLSFWGLPQYLIAGLTLVLGGSLAAVVSHALLSLRRVRRYMMGSAYIEGYWYLVTSHQAGSPLDPDGILFIRHEPVSGETQVVTTRLDTTGAEYASLSEIAHVRTSGSEIRYLNYFSLACPGMQAATGLSSGRFITSDDLLPYPNRLEAQINLSGEGTVRRQSADRICDRRVAQLKQLHGKKWLTVALSKGKSYLFEES